jgi:Leucine-rich repeat (LRR) protein
MKYYLALLSSLAFLGAGCYSDQQTPRIPPPIQQKTIQKDTSLDLSDKELKSIPMDVFSQINLTSLNLSKNKLTSAPQSQIGQLKNLETLNLSNNSLTGLPAELGQLSKLKVLDVSNNNLTGLPMELGNLTQLQILDISGNPYSSQDLNEISKKLSKTEIKR